MIYVLSFWSDVAFSIKQALRTFSCTVAAVIYNFIVESMVERTNQLLLEQQNKYIQNHLDMMENMIKIDRSFKHG